MGRFALTVVVPCLNEADNVESVYRQVVAELGADHDLELLFVDDGSTDQTLARARELAQRDPIVSYLSFTRNFGLEAAFSAGFRYARHPWVLQLDADLQFPPAEARRLVARAREGYDAVFGVRVDRRDRWVRRLASRVHDLLSRRLLGIELPPGGTSFRLVRTDLARRVVDLRLGTPYFLATLPRLTRGWTTVPVAHRPRLRGTPKVTLLGLARHATGLFISFSPRPIGLAALLCLVAAGLAVAAGVAAVLPDPGAAAGLLIALALAAGLLGLAVIARFLVHIASHPPRTPLFLVREASVPVRPEDHLPPATLPESAAGAEPAANAVPAPRTEPAMLPGPAEEPR